MEINHKIQFPDVMSGKKILYVHGFASSGSSGTVTKIREMLPGATVVAPDLPLHPAEAMELLRGLCDEEKPDLIIGTSMGGMYTEMKHGMLGRNTFLNPRQDGQTEFFVTKPLVEEYKEMTAQCFSAVTPEEANERVFGLFGDADPVVHTMDLFASRYRNAISFHGEHRMNDGILLHSVIPVVRWIDDRQEGRTRPIVYIGIDTLRDAHGRQQSSAMKAVNFLLENYTLYIIAQAPTDTPAYITDVITWANDVVNVPAWRHMVFTNRYDLLYGDYLIEPSDDCHAADFAGTRIRFGDDTFKTWEEIIEFFGRLGGQ